MTDDCTEKCRTPVTCATCQRRKKPIGRDVAPAANGDLCASECTGYREDPYPPHLWPGEDLPSATPGTTETGGG